MLHVSEQPHGRILEIVLPPVFLKVVCSLHAQWSMEIKDPCTDGLHGFQISLFRIEMSRPHVFFDVTIGGQPAGRIEFEVAAFDSPHA